jgi:Fur family ferric uptake transcriptional regulator
MTKQREVILNAAFATEDHFTAEELWKKARAIDPTTSRATLYRTLTLLLACGLLKEIDLGRGQKVFDPNFHDRPGHNHLICIDCGRVIEFEDAHITILEDCITRRLGFRPTTRSIRIEACCDQLRKDGVCEYLIKARLGDPKKKTATSPA